MKTVILFSENKDLIDSMKQAIAYCQHLPLKFHFYSDTALVKNHMVNLGLPDLLLYDQKLSSVTEVFPENLNKIKLTELPATSVKEVFIYQQMDNFIIDVIKSLNHLEPLSNVKSVVTSRTSSRSKVWLLDSSENDWSKACFVELQRRFYTLPNTSVCIDASLFGGASLQLSHAAHDDLSSLISDFIWDKAKYEDRLNGMKEENAAYIIQNVGHPMDLLSLEPEFWDLFGRHWCTMPTNQLLYSGMLSEGQLKTISQYYENLVLVGHAPDATQEKLNMIQDWFLQIAPSMRIRTLIREPGSISPESYAENLLRWAMQEKER